MMKQEASIFPHFNLPTTRARILKNSADEKRGREAREIPNTPHPIGQVHPVEWSAKKKEKGREEEGREGEGREEDGREEERESEKKSLL